MEPQQRDAHPREDQGGSMNLPTSSRGESQTALAFVALRSIDVNRAESERSKVVRAPSSDQSRVVVQVFCVMR